MDERDNPLGAEATGGVFVRSSSKPGKGSVGIFVQNALNLQTITHIY